MVREQVGEAQTMGALLRKAEEVNESQKRTMQNQKADEEKESKMLKCLSVKPN